MRNLLLTLAAFIGMSANAQTIVTPPSHPMTFKDVSTGGNCCEWIAADGEITPDTPNVFKSFLQSLGPDARSIHEEITFNSNGGDIVAAMALGREIRETSFSTGVGATTLDADDTLISGYHIYVDSPGLCMSACVLAFMGGKTRLLHPVDRLGFFDFDLDRSSGKGVHAFSMSAVALRQAVAAYSVEMNVDPEFLSEDVLMSERHEARYLSVSQALSWGLSTPSVP